MDATGQKANQPIKENSPYLLQHAHKPVEWTPEAKRPSPRQGLKINRCS